MPSDRRGRGPRTSALRAAETWLHDLVCMGHNVAEPYCTGEARDDHARRTQRERARDLVAASSVRELAAVVHPVICSVWAQGNHGGRYADMARAVCGDGGGRHIDALANSRQVRDLAASLGVTC